MDGMSLEALSAPLLEISHPFGQAAYTEAWKHRGTQHFRALPERELKAYDEDVCSLEPRDETAQAEGEGGDASHAMDGEGTGSNHTIDGEPSRLGAASEAGGASVSAVSNQSNTKGRKRSHSVALPQWMDLDQETLPRRPLIAVSHDTTRSKKVTTKLELPSQHLPQERQSVMNRPAKLDKFGSVGELTVQLRTARTVESEDVDFDALLALYSKEKEYVAKKQAMAAVIGEHASQNKGSRRSKSSGARTRARSLLVASCTINPCACS